MCLGLPMQVRAADIPGAVQCASRDQAGILRRVNTALLDASPTPGDWLLVHVDVAIRSLSEEEADLIGNALAAVTAAADGKPFEHLIADLVDREPQLPEHLRPATDDKVQTHG